MFISGCAILLLLSCNKEVDPTKPITEGIMDDPNSISVNGKIKLTGSLSMEEGPQQLIVSGNNLYAKRDYSLFKLSLANEANPLLTHSYVHPQTKKFGKLYAKGNSIYAPNQDDGKIYVFNENLSLQNSYTVNIANFKPNTLLIDQNNVYWVGGSNGTNGILAKCTLNGTALTVESQWQASYNESMMESLVEKGNYIIASIPKGDVLSFSKSNVENGPVYNTTFTNDPGHEKWGRTIIELSGKVYWANWGAGLATVDVSDPSTLTVTNILSNSKFKSQYPNAEGTNVYDVVYNSNKQLLCIANGWSGVVIVSPNAPETVVDYIDPQYFQNMCIATKGDYIYTGNISGGMSGDLKGIKVFKLN